jgi:membrane-associated protease RseP (regulator of RpoE activity)
VLDVVATILVLAVLALPVVLKDRWADRRCRRYVEEWARGSGVGVTTLRRDRWRGYSGIPLGVLVLTRRRAYETTVTAAGPRAASRRARLWVGGSVLGALSGAVDVEWLA